MKRKYSAPKMEFEVFKANEYVAGCYTCLNMNYAQAVYYDTDGDGVKDDNETSKYTGWGEMNDCGTDGSGNRLAHYMTDEEAAACTKVLVQYGTNTYTPALMVTGRFSNSPHFCERKSNAS